MAIKLDLIMLYKCYRHENPFKESQKYIFENFICVRPLIRFGKSRKSSKNRKNRDFSKIDILLFSGWKYDIWPEISSLDPGKPSESLYLPSYIIWLYFVKSQKNRIFHLQNQHKIFFRSNILADVARPPNQYQGSTHHIPAPKAL